MPVAPKFEPARRNARVGPLVLPAEGRPGPPPDWPCIRPAMPGEQRVWTEVWSCPQAVQWERAGAATVRAVARWCIIVAAIEALPIPNPQLCAQAAVLEQQLGITPKAMRTLLWTVGEPGADESEDEVAAARRARAAGAVRTRIRAVD